MENMNEKDSKQITERNKETYWAMKHVGILQYSVIHQQDIKRHNALEIPSSFVLVVWRFTIEELQNRYQEISYIQSPTPANKCKGEYIEVYYKISQALSHLRGKISSLTRTEIADETLLQSLMNFKGS